MGYRGCLVAAKRLWYRSAPEPAKQSDRTGSNRTGGRMRQWLAPAPIGRRRSVHCHCAPLLRTMFSLCPLPFSQVPFSFGACIQLPYDSGAQSTSQTKPQGRVHHEARTLGPLHTVFSGPKSTVQKSQRVSATKTKIAYGQVHGFVEDNVMVKSHTVSDH